MKAISIKEVIEIVKQDYSKAILFAPEDFSTGSHQLQVVTIPPNTKQREHFHTTQSEVFYILEGSCEIYINEKVFVAKPGDAFITDPGDTHNLWNKSDRPFKLVVFKINFPKKDDTIWKE